jgi:hypothetical protein
MLFSCVIERVHQYRQSRSAAHAILCINAVRLTRTLASIAAVERGPLCPMPVPSNGDQRWLAKNGWGIDAFF